MRLANYMYNTINPKIQLYMMVILFIILPSIILFYILLNVLKKILFGNDDNEYNYEELGLTKEQYEILLIGYNESVNCGTCTTFEEYIEKVGVEK